jgi:uncharacterized protein
MFEIAIASVAVAAAAIASIAGFGIGSLLTPLLALESGTKVAVAAVAIPHLVASAQRFWILRRHVEREVLFGFGIASAIGGLAGAIGHIWLSSRWLSIVFGALLVVAAISEFTAWIERVRWGRRAAWVAGVASGAFGGLVGNQGGIRSAAMLGFKVPKESFVATATAVALFVDGARLPVYLATQWEDIVGVWQQVAIATAGVVVGTALGARLLERVPQRLFRRIVACLLLALGVYMMLAGGRE